MTTDSMDIVQSLLSVSQSGPDEYTGDHNPRSLGNPPPVAFGGCAIGSAVLSAYQTVPDPNFHLYSVLGSFHGSTRNDRPVICRVTRTRDTRTFATRRVTVCQKMDDGQERNCMEMLFDFHVLEDGMFRYSARPSLPYGWDPEDAQTTSTNLEIARKMVEKGQMPSSIPQIYSAAFKLMEDYFETRMCLAGVSAQVLSGFAKHLDTTQDDRHITEKSSGEWLRLRRPVNGRAGNAAALAFDTDSGLGPLPLVFNHQNLFDTNVGACATLEFSLRIMVPDIQLHKWHLKEKRTIAAAAGRTYSESRLWDEDGNMVAMNTQTCILRERKGKDKARM